MKFGVGKKSSIGRKLIILFLILIIFYAPPLVGSDSWPMFLRDPQHTGNTGSTAPNTNYTLWTRPTIGGAGYSSPSVANGRVFVNGDGILYSLHEYNGTEIWNKSIGFAGERCSTPTVANGKVYIIGDKVRCFYENNGTEIWNKSVSGYGTGTSSPTVADGKVFVNTETLYCFYESNGTQIWNKSVGFSGESTPAVAYGKVFVIGQRLYCFYANNGTKVWDTTSIWPGTSNSPVVANGKVFYNPQTITCLYENNGSEIWNEMYGGDGYSSPAVANDKVFVNVKGKIYCYYENNGTEIWNITINAEGCSTPAVSSDGKVLVNGWGYTYCLDENNGKEIWNISTGGPGYSSPVIANGRVFVNQGTIYCFGSPPQKIDYIVIEDNAHNELTTVYLNISESMTLYAAGYNSTTSSFVGYVKVNWTENGGLGSFDPPMGTSTTYTPGQTFGITNITGENVVLVLSDNFVIEINPSTILRQGWNLISIPLIQEDQNFTNVFASIDGLYNAVEWYDIINTDDNWKIYNVDKPVGNDISEINETMGFWIHINQPGDTIFVYNGTLPTANQTITLYPGWNLVGYPSLSNRDRTDALNNIDFSIDVDSIWTYDAETQKWKEIGESDYFELGRGYWIHSKVEKVWNVPL